MSRDSTRNAEIKFNAALKAQNEGRGDDAMALYEEVLNLDPRHTNALHNYGLLVMGRGSSGAAYPYLKFSVELNDKIAETRNTLGNCLYNLGFKDEAEAEYRKSVALKPRYAIAWRGLARLLAESNRALEAETSYRKAIEIKPDYRDALINLGNLMRYKNVNEAIALTRRAIEVDPKSASALNNLGNYLRDIDKLDEAADFYRRAVETDPDLYIAWLNLGTVLNHLGKRGPAVEALRRAIAIDPERGDPYFQLAVTTKLKLDDPAVAAMRRLYADTKLPDNERMFVAFGLGRVSDENKLYDDAFGFWHVGNKIKKASARCNIKNEESIAERMRARYNAEFLASTPKSKVTDKTPIFVVGMIRSGTTLMEQILASHPMVLGADENTFLPEAAQTIQAYTQSEFTRIGELYIQKLRDRYGSESPRISDKLVGNWLYVGLIHLALPNAKIICLRRNPYDSCVSAYGSLFTSFHEYCYDMEDVAKFYNIFKGMADYWEQVLPGRVYQQSYEKLIAQPEEEVRKILNYCELPFDERCLAFDKTERRVRTASAQQVREKLHSRSIERWRNYGHHIDPWRPILGDPEAWSVS